MASSVAPPSDRRVLVRFFLTLFLVAIVLGPLLFFITGGYWPFHRVMDRALMIAALVALCVAWPRLRFRAWWVPRRPAAGEALLGALAGVVSVQTIVALDFALGGLRWKTGAAHGLPGLFAAAVAAALLVPLVEETVFRGFLQTELSRRLGATGGWLVAAPIYAVAHFVKIPNAVDHHPVHFWSGATALGVAFGALGQGGFLGVYGLNLLLIGLILGGVFRRTGNLWFNYGLHGVWIVALLLTARFFEPAAATFWSGANLPGSSLTTCVLAVLGWWLWRFYRRPGSAPGATPP